jgi:hypothetical protein
MKVRALVLAAALVVVIGLPAAAEPALKTEVTDCFAYATNETPGLAYGDGWLCAPFTAVIVSNANTWTLVAKATVDVDLDYAVKLDKGVIGYDCGASAEALVPGLVRTENWQSVSTPSGNAKIVCQGVME